MKTCARCGKEVDGGFICETTGKFYCKDCNDAALKFCKHDEKTLEHHHNSWGTQDPRSEDDRL